MIEEIKTKKAELLELVYSNISALEDELQETESYLAELEEKMRYLNRLAESLA
jgi:hypothetical protein